MSCWWHQYYLWCLFSKHFKLFLQLIFRLYFHLTAFPVFDICAQKLMPDPSTNHKILKISLRIFKTLVITFDFTCDILLSSTYHNKVQCFLPIIMFATHLPYGLILKHNPLGINPYILYHSIYYSMQLCIPCSNLSTKTFVCFHTLHIFVF